METAALSRFSAATQQWFTDSFDAPTDAQTGAWTAISSHQHTLVVAPTGSGKTLSAFLWALDRLATQPIPERAQRCRVLYISPLKALAVDVERNLRSPLAGISAAAEALGLPRPEVRVAVRSGDTPAEERRAFARTPADILITTPESLFLLLTSAAREALANIETVIIDEVHALAGTKRGAHLALSLERLEELLPQPAQRIGLSATVRPVEEVSRFLAGGRPVTVVTPPSNKRWELSVVVPVPDLGELGGANSAIDGQSSIWPHVEERIVDQIAAHRSTLVFVNSRRLAERLTARLNEIWAERCEQTSEADQPRSAPPRRMPAEVMAQSALGHGAPPVLARAHHGSVSKEQRQVVEAELKAGTLPAVVATSSLELGIDMGAIDLVIQVESPPSVASGLQRVGRAGHQVGAVSRGVLYPKFRGDLVQSAVAVQQMLAGRIEALHLPANPLDVLAQQIVAMVAMDTWSVDRLHQVVSRAAPFTTVSRSVLEAVLDMLAGRYPSEEFAELRPRLTWDRSTDLLTGRRSAQRLAVTSGGTIPDRGLYTVFLAGEDAGRRVGELDEEMVYESRVGDVIALGTSSWRIAEITHDRVLVVPAPGQAARLPFWKGDSLGRPAEFGRAVGSFVRELSELAPTQARARLGALGLDEWAVDNLLGYLTEQREAISQLPHDRQLVVERFRDQLGDWHVVVHSPFGAQVHAPWALLAAARLRERFGVDVQAMHADDGLIFRLPDTDWGDDPDPVTGAIGGPGVELGELLELILLDPDDIATAVTEQLAGSALFASRFRECAGRALLLPNRRPGKRQALWQQRLRSSQLLQVASSYPRFPIVLEAVRECVNDVFDVPALVDLMGEIRARRVATVTVDTAQPSPFAASLQFGYVAQFLYDDDSPLAERRAAALSLDPGLLAELIGTVEGLALADLLDPDALTVTEQERQHLTPNRKARDAEDVADLLRMLGPLTTAAVSARAREPERVAEWLADLAARRQVLPLPADRWAVVEDAARVRDALAVTLPSDLPEAFTTAVTDPLGDLLSRYARTHTVFTAAEAAQWLGIDAATVRRALRRLVAAGRVVEGELRPPGWHPPGDHRDSDSPSEQIETPGPQFCDADVLRMLRRRSLAALRQGTEPVAATDFARFLPSWQGVGQRHGIDGVLHTIEQLAGVPIPASAWESLILPSRVSDYAPALLDELTAAGEVLWQGHGCLGANDGWISLHPAELAAATLTPPDATLSATAAAALDAVGTGGHFFRNLAEATGLGPTELTEALWELVWAGHLTNDTFVGLRALLSGGSGSHRQRPVPASGRHRPALSTAALMRRSSPAQMAGRWSALPAAQTEETLRAVTRAELLLDRYGVLTRGSVAAENVPGGFATVYRVLAAGEEAGRLRRGYFIEGLGAAQFAGPGAVDRLRDTKPETDRPPSALVLAATDPANPYGAALAWPARPATGHQPGRKAGALVVLVDGELVLYVERGGRTLLSWTDRSEVLATACAALAAAVHAGVLGRLTVTKLDGEAALGSSQPLAQALAAAGFGLTPQGLRLRR